MNWILLALIVAAFAAIELMVGGAGTLFFPLPAYLLTGAAAVMSIGVLKRNGVRPDGLCLVAAILLTVCVLMRGWLSPVFHLARPDMLMVTAALALYLIFALYLTNPRYRTAVIGLLLALVLVQSFVAAIQFTQAGNFMLIPQLGRPDYGWRASGFYTCPNHFAGFLEVIAVFGVSLVCWSRWPAWTKLLTAWVVLIAIGAQILTGSRGGYLSLAAGLGSCAVLSLFVVRTVARHRFWLATAAMVFIAVILAAGVGYSFLKSDVVRERMSHIADTENPRLPLWQGAIKQFQLSPAVGTGAGTYLYHARHFRPPSIVNDPVYTHNDYLHLLAEYGIIGAAAMGFFLVVHIAGGLRRIRWIAEERLASTGRTQSTALALTIGALSAVAAYLAHSVFDFNLHIPANALLMAFVFAILANPGVDRGRAPALGRLANGGARAILPVAGIALLIAGGALLRSEYYGELARRAVAGKDFTKAMGYAQKALADRPDNPDFHYYMGWSQYKISRKHESAMVRKIVGQAAADSLKRGVEKMPQDTRLQVALGHVLRRIGQYEESDEAYRTAIEWDPNAAWIRARYGHMLKESGDLEGAEAQFEKSQELRGNTLARKGIEQVKKRRKAEQRSDDGETMPRSF